MVERINRTLEAQLSKIVDEHQRNWDHCIPFLMMVLRSATHETTKCSPAMLEFGHELRLPIDLLLGRPEEPATTTDYCELLQERLEQVHSCDLCASRRGPPRKQRAPMHRYNVGAPAERIALNVLGPLPTTESGNKYVLLVANYFTKWPEAYSPPNQEAVTLAEVLVKEYICRFGVPLEIHSDQGRNFESNVFQEMCSLLGIRKTRTTPLHPTPRRT